VIYILTGSVHSGKTTLLNSIVALLADKNVKIDGYLSEAIWKNEEFIGYDLVDLKDQMHHPFIRKQGGEKWERIGPFYFQPETLDMAKKIIHRSKEADLCVVDEVGPLELKDKGIWPALKDVLETSGQNMLIVARGSILTDLIEKMQKEDILVYDIEQDIKPIRLVESIMQGLKKRRE
jgi:iron complex transport system ATP-binding protein